MNKIRIARSERELMWNRYSSAFMAFVSLVIAILSAIIGIMTLAGYSPTQLIGAGDLLIVSMLLSATLLNFAIFSTMYAYRVSSIYYQEYWHYGFLMGVGYLVAGANALLSSLILQTIPSAMGIIFVIGGFSTLYRLAEYRDYMKTDEFKSKFIPSTDFWIRLPYVSFSIWIVLLLLGYIVYLI